METYTQSLRTQHGTTTPIYNMHSFTIRHSLWSHIRFTDFHPFWLHRIRPMSTRFHFNVSIHRQPIVVAVRSTIRRFINFSRKKKLRPNYCLFQRSVVWHICFPRDCHWNLEIVISDQVLIYFEIIFSKWSHSHFLRFCDDRSLYLLILTLCGCDCVCP